MPDREKVIKELRKLHGSKETMKLISDTISLLKEQEAVVRCKDCKHRPKKPDWETYESGFDLEFPEGSKCPCRCCGDEWYSWYPEDNWFCADGERKDDDTQ